MACVAAQNARVQDPVYHVVLSWPEGESPTDAQAFSAGAYAMDAVGMAGHQYVFAVHRDTSHVHLHMAVNRVNPETFNVVYPERDYFKLDRAMRELELAQGWRHDKGPYAVFQRGGTLVIDWASSSQNTKEKKPASAADMERHGDKESLFEYVRGAPRKALLNALKNDQLTWQQLHNLLSRYGLEIKEKGQGFAIYAMGSPDITPVKASDMHEQLSRKRLEGRLGPIELKGPALDEVSTYDRDKAPKRDPAEREERRQERAAARRDLRHRYELYRRGFVVKRVSQAEVKNAFAALKAQARVRREDVFANVPNAATRKALYSVIAFETLLAKDRLRRDFATRRKELKSAPANRCLTYRSWVEEQAAGGDAAAIGQLRGWSYAERRNASGLDGLPPGIIGVIRKAEAGDSIPSDGAGSYSVRRDGVVVYMSKEGAPIVEDRGHELWIRGSADERAAIATALMLATSERQPPGAVVGEAAFKALVEDELRRLNSARDAQVKGGAPQSRTNGPLQRTNAGKPRTGNK